MYEIKKSTLPMFFELFTIIILITIMIMLHIYNTTILHFLAQSVCLKSWQLLCSQLRCRWWRHRRNRSGQPSGIPIFQSAWFMESFLILNPLFQNPIHQHFYMIIILFLFNRVNRPSSGFLVESSVKSETINYCLIFLSQAIKVSGKMFMSTE